MIQKTITIVVSGEPNKINGSGPQLFPIYDEMDHIVRAYGREAVIKMFNEARPKL